MTGDQIRDMRKGLGLTVPDLGAAIGVSGQGIRNWEACGPNSAAPQERWSRRWDALVLFLSTATPKPAEGPKRIAPSSAGLLWPWLETAGPEYRSRIREIVRAA